jgi:hypothetical protein
MIMPAKSLESELMPIGFISELAPLVVAGSKTETRRLMPPVKHPQWTAWKWYPDEQIAIEVGPDYPDGDDDVIRCPYGKPGDLLRVREKHALLDSDGRLCRNDTAAFVIFPDGSILARAGRAPAWALKLRDSGEFLRRVGRSWRSGRFLPRWGSRAILRVTEIDVQQVQRISAVEAIAEGASARFLCNRLHLIASRVRRSPAFVMQMAEPVVVCLKCLKRQPRPGPADDAREHTREENAPLYCANCSAPLEYRLTQAAGRRHLTTPNVSVDDPDEAYRYLVAVDAAWLGKLRRNEADAISGAMARTCFQVLWSRIHRHDHTRWEANPQVWVVRFKIDSLAMFA